MSESKRKFFSAGQKAKVALEAIRGTKTINEIAQEYGVHPTQVGVWKKELLDNAGSVFEPRFSISSQFLMEAISAID